MEDVREWRKEVYRDWPFSVDQEKLAQVAEVMKVRLQLRELQYEAILYDGASVRFGDYERFVRFLKEETSPSRRIASLILSGANGPSRAIKLLFNRLLLSALWVADLQLQLATISYAVVSSSRDDLLLCQSDLDQRLEGLRQRGTPRLLSTLGASPLLWSATVFVLMLMMYAIGLLAYLEALPRSGLSQWIRDHNTAFYMLGSLAILLLFTAPWLFRALYPIAVFRIGWEVERMEKLEKLRWQVFWTIIVGSILGVLFRVVITSRSRSRPFSSLS